MIESLSTEFDPGKYTSNYREALMEVIEAKIAGEEIAVPDKPEGATVIDLMEALKASITQAQEVKKEEKKASKKKTTKTKTKVSG